MIFTRCVEFQVGKHGDLTVCDAGEAQDGMLHQVQEGHGVDSLRALWTFYLCININSAFLWMNTCYRIVTPGVRPSAIEIMEKPEQDALSAAEEGLGLSTRCQSGDNRRLSHYWPGSSSSALVSSPKAARSPRISERALTRYPPLVCHPPPDRVERYADHDIPQRTAAPPALLIKACHPPLRAPPTTIHPSTYPTPIPR